MCLDRVRASMASGIHKDNLQAQMFLLADMATQIFAARRMLYHAADRRDKGQGVTHEASMVKLFCTEMASRIADMALDIFGDAGYLTKNRIETFMRDVRLYRLYEGTSEIQRLVISRNLVKRLLRKELNDDPGCHCQRCAHSGGEVHGRAQDCRGV
jgi:acyl-CoA dehydrogenase